MRDDFDTNLKFIEIVRMNPCLYDQTRPDYSNRNKQNKVWGDIAKQLNETVATCRDRWKNIRGRYVKQINKPPPSGSAAKSKKPYYLAEYLSFLDSFIRSRAPTGNESPSAEINAVRSCDFTEEKSISTPNSSDADEKSYRRDEEQEAYQIPEFTDTSNPSTPEPTASVSSQSKYRRKTKQTTVSQLNRSAIKYFEKRRKRKYSAPAVLDPDEAFLKSLLPDMKNMTEAQKRNFKVAILRVAGEILNQPVVTPPSISHLQTTDYPVQLPTQIDQSLLPIYSCIEKREREETSDE